MEKFFRINAPLKLIVLLLGVASSSLAQVPQFDKIEQLYDQGRYQIVYRKSRRLINKPEFDYSLLPKYYQSISSLQLLRNKVWLSRHENQIDFAFSFLEVLGKTEKGAQLKVNHSHELIALQNDLNDWLAELSLEKGNENQRVYSLKISTLSKSLPQITIDSSIERWSPNEIEGKELAISMIRYAQTFVGTPYVWGGQSEQGFDCSGFTSYVFLNQGKKIPRVSRYQYASSIKLDASEACIGDLVFFGQQGLVSHVGILINEVGKPKRMIHASSTKGVTFQDIDNSSYYSSRVIGYGRY